MLSASAYGQGVGTMSVGTNNALLERVPKPPVAVQAAQAETAEQVAARVAEYNKRCDPFLWTDAREGWRREPTREGEEPRSKSLSLCLTSSRDAAEAAGNAKDPNTLALIRAHVNYKRFKPWVAQAKEDLPQRTSENATEWETDSLEVFELERELAELRQAVHDALRAHGLNDPLTAMIFTGASFGDASPTQSKAAAGTDAKTTKKAEESPAGPSAQVLFESPHFRDDENGWAHFAFGGRVGFQQVMSMVKPTTEAGAAPTDTTPVAVYKDGLVWNVGVSAYTLAHGPSEAYVRASIGGTRIGDTRSILTAENGQGFIAVPADADAKVSAMRWEVGIGWNYYGRPMEIAHLDKGLMNPAFSAFLLRRQDQRFKKTGDLADFEHPETRWVYGISVNLRNLVRSDGGDVPPTKANTFDFGFSVEREFARGSGLRIPDSTRYIVRGEINILRALAGATEKKADPKPDPPPAR
jgi:hypothetical protein